MTPWREWLRVSLAIGVPPKDFWSLSLREWRAIAGDFTAPRPLRRAELMALSARHPDRLEKKHE